MASGKLQRQIDRILDEAKEAISRFDWDALLQRAQAVLAMDPANGDSPAFLATAERALATAAALPSSQSSTLVPVATPIATTDHPTSFASGGYRPKLAWTCCDYADLLLERNGEGDRAKTMSLPDEYLAISSEPGMRPLMERVLSRREILNARWVGQRVLDLALYG